MVAMGFMPYPLLNVTFVSTRLSPFVSYWVCDCSAWGQYQLSCLQAPMTV